MNLTVRHKDDSWARQLCFALTIVIIPKKKGPTGGRQGTPRGTGNFASISRISSAVRHLDRLAISTKFAILPALRSTCTLA